jgi:hypothetical protein
MKFPVLRQGVRQDTLDNILFPEDPINQFAQIVASLEQAFPIQKGHYSFGPMGIIGYGTPTLITLELGLMIEVPGPRIAILGVLKALLPDEKTKILRLQVNFLGTIDFEKKYITFDASLYDSKLLSLTLSGDMAFRMIYGENPYFLFTVGGFHPQFQAPPLDLPTIRRLTIALFDTDRFKLTLKTYFAVTSNTAQFGARVDLYVRIGAFLGAEYGVVGFLAFDALFQFSPFYVILSLSGGLTLMNLKKNKPLLGGFFEATLEGPSPWRVYGKAWATIARITLSKNFNKTFGQRKDTALPDISVLSLLRTEIETLSNWEAKLPSQKALSVTIRNLGITEEVVAHPYGIMAFNQKKVPLGVNLEKYGQQKPIGATYFDLDLWDSMGNEFTGVEDLEESFAPGDFEALTKAEKFNRPSFETMRSGVVIKGDEEIRGSFFRQVSLTYEHLIIDVTGGGDVQARSMEPVSNEPIFHETRASGVSIDDLQFQAELRNGTAAISNRGRALQQRRRPATGPMQVQLDRRRYTIAQHSDLSVYQNIDVGSYLEASQQLKAFQSADASLQNELSILSTWEVEAVTTP